MNQSKTIDNLRLHTRAGTLSSEVSMRARPRIAIVSDLTPIVKPRVHMQWPYDTINTGQLRSVLLAKAYSAFYPDPMESVSPFCLDGSSCKHVDQYDSTTSCKSRWTVKPLTWIMNVRDPRSRLLRWRIQLQECDYEIVYKRGVQNLNADALSRVAALTKTKEELDKIDDETKTKILRKKL